MKTFSTIVLLFLASFVFGQKVCDTTFITKHDKATNIRLSKKWFNELDNTERIIATDKTDELSISFLWLGKTDYFDKKNNEDVIVDVQINVSIRFVDSKITISVDAMEFKSFGKIDNEVQKDILYFEVLKSNTRRMLNDLARHINTQNPITSKSVMSEGIDILLKAENQTDIAVGLSIASGVVGSIVAANNPRAGVVITLIGGTVGLAVWIGSRINKRKGLKKLKETA